MNMLLRSTILRILKEQLDLNTQNIKNKYVGEGKPMTEEDFQKLMDVTGGKFYLLSWLAKKVGQNIIKAEDIYKYKEYFDIYEKNKNKGKFQYKDIHLYKTPEDVLNFIEEVIKVREGDIKFEETVGKDNYVIPNDIRKLEETGGIKYLGMFEKYQVFQIFKVAKDVWKMYRDILGKCKGRSKGAKIDICTIGDYDYFKQYLTDPKGSSYFLLYNLDDPKSPYQLHYESGQFMDKNDNSRIGIDQLKFFEWISPRVPKYSLEREDFPGSFELPVYGKGTKDEKGRRQGLWRDVQDGKLQAIYTFVNGKTRGPYVLYHNNGKIEEKGTLGPNDRVVGDYEEYYDDGRIVRKGTYDDNANRIGYWIDGDYDGVYTLTNYNDFPIQVSGFTKNGKLRYISSLNSYRGVTGAFGETTLFYESGNVAAVGKLGVNGDRLGEWIYYSPDGKIRAEGKFVRGKRQGQWTDVIDTKNKGKVILVADFYRDIPSDDIKVYDKNGEFIKKVDYRKIKPDRYWTRLNTNTRGFKKD